MLHVKINVGDCLYCFGKGYFQLVLGGSETCRCCGGTGKEQKIEEKCTL